MASTDSNAPTPAPRPDPGDWGDVTIAPGERRAVSITVSESYSGATIRTPVYVWRGEAPGPTVFVSAAVHGDEINGTGAIREIITGEPFRLRAGTLLMSPVVNMLGFERHSRYMPDRRDLNRCFPGSESGSLSSRLARAYFDQVVRRCDYGIDLHTAAVRRTNFPNVRADMTDPRVAEWARAFGAEILVAGKGPRGSLRRGACSAGVPTFILEAGEVWRVEPAVVEYAVEGVRSCLAHLGMIEGEARKPAYRVEMDSTRWVRAMHGGFLQFHTSPGELVEKGQPIATSASLTGQEHDVIVAPRDGIVLGMTTMPSVAPGDPVCHLAFPKRGVLRRVGEVVEAMPDDSLHERLKEDLSRGILVSEPNAEEPK